MQSDTNRLSKDHRVARVKIEELLRTISEKDRNEFTMLFSKDALSKTEGFDDSVEELFTYFEGKVVSYDDGAGPYVENSREGNWNCQIMESSFDVKTTKGEYRLAIRFVTEDTINADKIGIQSLYILNASEDTCPEYVYWGDGRFDCGIHVAVPNAE